MNAHHRDAKLPPNGSLPCEAGEGWGGGVKTPRSDKFTYTFPATLYVNVGWGLPHRADATAGTNVQNPAILPLPLWGRVGLPMKKASAFFMGTRGGVTGGTPGVYINNPPAAPTLFRLHTPSPLPCM